MLFVTLCAHNWLKPSMQCIVLEQNSSLVLIADLALWVASQRRKSVTRIA